MKTRAALLACVLTALPFLAACHEGDKADHHAAKASMGAVNSTCPISGESVNGMGEPVTTSYHGETVAFCCKKCVAKWNKMSDADKAEHLAATKK